MVLLIHMKRYFVRLVFFVVAVGLLLTPQSLAQTSNEHASRETICLKTRPASALDTWTDTITTKNLFAEFASGSTVYVVACTGTGAGRLCSTGNVTMDTELYGKAPSATQVVNVLFYHAGNHAVVNPKFVLRDGETRVNVDAQVGKTNNGSGQYSFFGIGVPPPVPPTAAAIGGNETLQQSLVPLTTEEGQCASVTIAPPASNAPIMRKILSNNNKDPYGVVFDSKSLEPLSNVTVTIRNEAGVPLENNLLLKNNTVTTEDGVYYYLVTPGGYLLTFTVPTGYEFKAAPVSNPNMNQVYDFIDENETKNRCSIYKPGEVINEKAAMPECRNIPLEPVSTSPTVKKPVSMFYSLDKNEGDEVYILKGKVSHALSTVVAYQNVKGSGGAPPQKLELGQIESNHSGFYTLEVPFSKVLPEYPIEVEFVKSSLFGSSVQSALPFININKVFSNIVNSLVKSVNAQTSSKTSLSLDPPPSYVEGYAYYEGQQQIIPNAQVEVRLKNGDGIFSKTTADKNGYFYIPSGDLPLILELEFYLNIAKPEGGNIQYRIYQFTQANKYYFAQEKINLFTGKKNGQDATPQEPDKTGRYATSASGSTKAGVQQNTSGSRTSTTPSTNDRTTENTFISNPANRQVILIIIALVVLGIIGVGAAVVILKKNTPLPPV